MTINSKTIERIGILLVALSVVLVAAGPAIAAAPTVDTETVDTSTQSNVTDGTVWTNFSANANETRYFEAQFDSNDPQLKIKDPATGEVVNVVAESDMSQTYADAANSTWYYNHSFTGSEFARVPIAAGQNKSVSVVAVNNSSLSSPDTTNLTVYLDGVGDRTVIRAGDTVVSQDFEIRNKTLAFGIAPEFAGYGPETKFEREDVGVGGTNSTLTLALDNSSVASDWDSAVSGAPAGEWVESTAATLTADGEDVYVPLYANTAPDDIEDGQTYGVINPDEDTIVFRLGDEMDGVNQTDVTVDTTATLGQRITAYTAAAQNMLPIGALSVGALGVGLAFSGRYLGRDNEPDVVDYTLDEEAEE